MTNELNSSVNPTGQKQRDSAMRRGVGLLALATVVAGLVFASGESMHGASPGAAPGPGAVGAYDSSAERVSSPGAPVPASEFDPATLVPQQPAVGMPEHG
ncbi:MAG: hypothetical protein ACREBN_02270 [Burkholderiaceae bacterium]